MKQSFLSYTQQLFFLSTLLSSSLCIANLPYTGQNIWHVAADIGTEVDEISSKIDACCMGTFTTLAELQTDLDGCCAAIESDLDVINNNLIACCNIVESQLDVVETTLEACCMGTFTVLAAGSVCNLIPITKPTIITNAGSYCLANSVTNITIAASDVTLDLNGYFVSPSGTNAITIDNSSIRSNISIKNGILDGTNFGASGINGIGMSSSDGVLNVQLSNLNIYGFATSAGLNMSNIFGLKIESCDCSLSGTGANFDACQRIIVQNSSFDGNLIGVSDITPCTNLTFKNCTFNNNRADGVLFEFSMCLTMIECQASENLSSGFTFTSDAGNSTNDINLENCLACDNIFTGFVITTSAGTSSELTGCNAQHNNIGFDMSGSLGNGVIQNCKAVNNNTCGFNDNSFSLYEYIGNVGQHNDGTPAVSTGDSNYCWADLSTTSTFISPYGPGYQPFYQSARNINGSFAGTASWDNITLK